MYNRDIEETLEKLRSRVLKVTGVDVVTEKRRFREIVNAKKIFSTIARQKYITYHQLGEFLGVTHASCINHAKDFEYLCKYDPQVKNNYLRVLGKPLEGKLDRELFDLSIGML